MTDKIMCRFNADAGQWLASFDGEPQTTFGGDLAVIAICRLLEGSLAGRYRLICESDGVGSKMLLRPMVWNPPDLFFVCPNCKGRGEYVGLMEQQTCEPCAGRGLVPA